VPGVIPSARQMTRIGMTKPGELRAAAQRYREIGKRITDPRTIDALAELAQEYERMADEIERRDVEGPS
jgi:hypothetical protein